MSYRDELEAAHNRIDSLQKQLDGAKGKSVALTRTGNSALAVPADQKSAVRWLGAPVRYRYERIVEGSIDASCYAELVQCISDGLDQTGQSSTVPNRLDWTTQASSQSGGLDQYSISITNINDQVTIRGQVRVAGLAGGIYGGIGGGVGLGAVFGPAMLVLVNPILGVAAAATWLGGTAWACRKLFQKSSRKRQDKLTVVLDEMEAIVKRSLLSENPDDRG